jgi:hypothetical protein
VSSLSCFISGVLVSFCNSTTEAKVGTGSSPGVVRLGPSRIAATVMVRAGRQGAEPSSADGATVEDEDEG